MKIIHVLCEGQTEQGFVDNVLKPYLRIESDVVLKSILATTNKKKNARGGIVSFAHVKNDLDILFKSNIDNDFEQHIFTTMFDFYALPTDFPGFFESEAIDDKYNKIGVLEDAFYNAIGNHRFIPYIQLHEFEALIFCGLEWLNDLYPEKDKDIHKLANILADFSDNPELINNNPSTAPKQEDYRSDRGRQRQILSIQ